MAKTKSKTKTARIRKPSPQRTKTPDRSPAIRAAVLQAVEACDAKKAADIALLALEPGGGAFTDYFVLCSGSNPRQIQAISDEVEQRLTQSGLRPTHVEGYNQAEWVLLDYVDFVVHVFSENARRFYDLERLWKSAKRLTPAEVLAPARRTPKKATVKTATGKTKAKARRNGTGKRKSVPARRKRP